MNLKPLPLATLALIGVITSCGQSGAPSMGASSTDAPQPSACAAAAATAQDGAPLRHRGRSLVDGQGRIVLLHGVNAVWKLAPYAPPDDKTGFTAADADFLAANGFNVVRLGVLFAGVMPSEGVTDNSYLDKVDRVVQLLAARHIWTLLDFHQDMLNEKYQGEGFAPWAVVDDGLPNDANKGFPGNEFASLTLNHVFDNFWSNRNGIWDRYRDAWTVAAARWRDQPWLLGYDLFNEPWPGTQWPTCFELDCPAFDKTIQTFQEEALAGVRASDTRHLAFFEPQQLFDFGAPSGMTAESDPQLGLSWHAYCSSTLTAGSGAPELPDCNLVKVESKTMNNADAQADALGAASLITEFSATDDNVDTARVADLADQHLVSWAVWAYKGWNDPTGNPAGQGLFTDDTDLTTLKAAKADILIRPFAQAIAGTPSSTSFDPSTHVFKLAYTTATGPAGGITEIFIPQRHYPAGYQATITGGKRVSAAGARVMQVEADCGAQQVMVNVEPAGT